MSKSVHKRGNESRGKSHSGIHLVSTATKISDLAHMGDVTSLSEDSSKLQFFLNHTRDSLSTFETHFTHSRCKLSSQNWNSPKPNLV